MWMSWDFAVIDDINEGARSFGFHFVDEPEARHAQGFENIVRRTPDYEAWRAAWEAALARTQNERIADLETHALWLRVLAEHPIHGYRLDRSPQPPATQGGWRQRYGLTRREYVAWALVVCVPALLLVAGIIAILIYQGPVD
jgi:hypothetical protein